MKNLLSWTNLFNLHFLKNDRNSHKFNRHNFYDHSKSYCTQQKLFFFYSERNKMVQAVPLVVLGVFATVSIVLFIGGCAITKNWYPLFIIIPAILTCVAAYLFVVTGQGGLEGGWISKDTYLFFVVVFGVSIIGLPLVFYHCSIINWKALAMHLAGDVATGIGFGLFVWLSQKYSDAY
ncbi:hypothetical protein TRFO_31042 [Tritrichomonas foetus]|uniref:Uncharacterized protein n=1 Tax=Tritrichomonas foetus TaxID=1144522 RepID=A0A1J4JTA4_9EUKA|nr:hypothetical protein TRFO_31042 [Tritrichomonas foetus]|eukprot:OHT01970.1 hypothetical protein TRFO_31042 [Tritrichomonas foetus]